jgi:signal transduction histidine kinase
VLLGTLVVLRDTTREHQARNAGAEFVAHVSHELKSPLNVISMYSDLLMGEDGQDEAMRVEATNAIHDNVERMAELIRNLLSIAKMENGSLTLDRQRVRLHEFLRDIVDSTAHGARGAGLRFDLRVAPELPALMLDKGLFGVAVKNLLTNAIKYNRPDGSVTVAADDTGEDIVIRVADTGIGIRPEDQEKVFDKFFRSSASEVLERSGHGLGLYLAREIVALHHGSLAVKSQPGTGSEFSLSLKKSHALLKETL